MSGIEAFFSCFSTTRHMFRVWYAQNKGVVPKLKLEPECFGGFRQPPVVEVVCGVMFEPMPRFSTAFFGVLWNLFGEEFPKTQDQQPLPSLVVPGQTFQVAQPPMPRVWFVSDDDTKLIQVQRDRFHYNWRRRGEDYEYPKFPSVFAPFKRYYEILAGFDRDAGGDGLNERHYELTYINHIPVSSHWAGFHEVAKVLPDISWRNEDSRFLPAPSAFRWDAQFPMPDGAGVLTAVARSARSTETGEPVLALDLTASGPAGTLSFDDWFTLAREWIVKGFIDLTDVNMQKQVWGKTEASSESG